MSHVILRISASRFDHLEAAIRLFNPDSSLAAFKKYIVQHRAKKGTLKRFLLATLRDAPAPLSSAQITDLWLEAGGLKIDDETRTVMRKRRGQTEAADGEAYCLGRIAG